MCSEAFNNFFAKDFSHRTIFNNGFCIEIVIFLFIKEREREITKKRKTYFTNTSLKCSCCVNKNQPRLLLFFFRLCGKSLATFRCASACLLRENIRSPLRRRRVQINASHPYYSRVCRMGFPLPTLQQCRNRKVYNNIVTSQHLHAPHKSSSILFSFALPSLSE